MQTLSFNTVARWKSAPSLSVILTGVSLALFVIFLAAGTVDPRLIDGVPAWAKPTKFAASFALMFATLAWLETRLSDEWRTGWILRITMILMAICFFAEIGYIGLQAGLSEASHFNLSTPYNYFMYMIVMAYGAIILVAGIGMYGFVAWADKEARLTPALRLATTLGFGASFVLTLFVAGYIGGNGTSLVGTPGVDHRTLPIVGWSAEVGDLRVSHFFALHAMQALPLLAAVLDYFKTSRRKVTIVAATTVYTLATVGLFLQALSGQPVIAL